METTLTMMSVLIITLMVALIMMSVKLGSQRIRIREQDAIIRRLLTRIDANRRSRTPEHHGLPRMFHPPGSPGGSPEPKWPTSKKP